MKHESEAVEETDHGFCKLSALSNLDPHCLVLCQLEGAYIQWPRVLRDVRFQGGVESEGVRISSTHYVKLDAGGSDA